MGNGQMERTGITLGGIQGRKIGGVKDRKIPLPIFPCRLPKKGAFHLRGGGLGRGGVPRATKEHERAPLTPPSRRDAWLPLHRN